jgi:hypothetical protein
MSGRETNASELRPPAFPALPALLSAAFYTIAFFALTWPAVTLYGTHWFADTSDGMQNVWNLWWVQHAVTVLHQNPWHTTYLHYPEGVSLLGHTLNAFNGFLAIGLSRLMAPVAVHNTIVTFSFVGGGVTAFLLAHHLTRAFIPSLVAGYIFTFSNFHFAHAEGHLQLVSLEWIPLFVLLWLKLVTRPTVALGVGAAVVLFLVILCDYYYFFYCVITGVVVVAWWLMRRPAGPLFDAQRVAAFSAFAAVALMTSGVLAGALTWSAGRDHLYGAHATSDYSMDLLSPLIYGGHWRFNELTRRFWTRLPGNIHESSVHLGFSVIALALYAWRKRREIRAPEMRLFAALALVFLVLALGPSPQIAGKPVLRNIPLLPYVWLETVFPPLVLSGVPLRMMVMVMLSAGILSAFGLAVLLRGPFAHRGAAVALLGVLVIEYLPKPIPMVTKDVPGYVEALRRLPGTDGVLDLVSDPSGALYFQTLHEKPLAFGYLARKPESVEARYETLMQVIEQQQFDRLWPDHRLRYVIATGQAPALRTWPGVTVIWDDGRTAIVDVSTAGKSSPRPGP